ncbi:MAG: PilZ domain-containing protein [Nitrospira sp.]|nr:MAG: PilZ domain-containing protein [Nitrospira sp.]
MPNAGLRERPFEDPTVTEQRQHVRYQVEFPAIFAGASSGLGIVYNLGMGGCKVVSNLPVKTGTRFTVHLQIPEQPIAITIQAATVQWTLKHEFGVEFHEMLEQERTRLGQFLATQANIVP